MAKNSQKTIFFDISSKKLAILTILTLGLYILYWFYKHWQIVKKSENVKIWPFWRTIFYIFFIWSLFSKIGNSATRQGYKPKFSHSHLAIIFIVLTILNIAIVKIEDWFIYFLVLLIATVLSLFPIILIQKAANFSNSKVKNNKITRGSSKGEKVFVACSIGLCLLAIAAVLFLPTYTPEQEAAINEQSTKVDSLSKQYEDCSTRLVRTEETLNSEDQTRVDAYNFEVDRCESVRLEQNKAVDAYNKMIQ